MWHFENNEAEFIKVVFSFVFSLSSCRVSNLFIFLIIVISLQNHYKSFVEIINFGHVIIYPMIRLLWFFIRTFLREQMAVQSRKKGSVIDFLMFYQISASGSFQKKQKKYILKFKFFLINLCCLLDFVLNVSNKFKNLKKKKKTGKKAFFNEKMFYALIKLFQRISIPLSWRGKHKETRHRFR